MNAFRLAVAAGGLAVLQACSATTGGGTNFEPIPTGEANGARAVTTDVTPVATERRGGFNPAAENPSLRGTTIRMAFNSPALAQEFANRYPGLIQSTIRASEAVRTVSERQNPGPNDGGYERFTRDALARQTVTLGGRTGTLGDFARIFVTEDQPRPSACPSSASDVLARAWSPTRQPTRALYAANIRANVLCPG